MSKRKKKHEEHIDESWLIPYADLLTLLLALFLVLYAMSSVDQHKFQELKEALNSIFSGGVGMMVSDKGLTEMDNNPFQNNPPPNYVTEDRTLRQSQKQMEAYLEEQGMKGLITTRLTDLGLMITIQDMAFFDSGEATLKPESVLLIEYIGTLLENVDNSIQIGGHTDSLPIRTSQYPSNWELSTDRASNVLQVLLRNPKQDPQRFCVVGFGQYKPVDTNDTPEGRQRNRRVEIMVLRQHTWPE